MVEKINLDMKGLNFVAIAQIVSLFYTVIVGGSSWIRAVSDLYSPEHSVFLRLMTLGFSFLQIGVGIAVIVFMIMGLSKLAQYSKKFEKARLFYVINLIYSVVFTFIVLVTCGIALVSRVSQGYDYRDISDFKHIIVTVMILVGIYQIVVTVLNIMYVRMLCFGCKELSLATGTIQLEQKFTKIEKVYRICTIIYSVGAIVSLSIIFSAALKIFDELSFFSSTYAPDLLTYFTTVPVVLAVILLLGLALMHLIVVMFLATYLWNGWKTFEGKEVYIGRGSNGIILIPMPDVATNNTSQDIQRGNI